MLQNFTKAWKTTILGSVIILAGLALIAFDKLDGTEFVLVAGVGVGLISSDILKEKKCKESK